MKIDYIEMAGFRGIRDTLRLDFSRGFTVIAGRNGVGKSTVCDAIEFAISGEIRKYRVEKADQETFSDYIWWRGSGVPSKCYVNIGFVEESGQQHEVLRTREDGLQVEDTYLVRLLCNKSSAPKDPLAQMCKTSIIRDEWIAAQSLDLKETERFDLVSAALGELETADFGEKAQHVLKLAEDKHARAQKAYDDLRSEVTATLSAVTEERSRVLSQGNVGAAIANIAKVIPNLSEEMVDAISAAQSFVSKAQNRISTLNDAAAVARQIADEVTATRSDEFQAEKRGVMRDGDELKTEKAKLEQQIADAKRALDALEATDTLSAALLSMVEGGELAGLDEGKCPLCAAERTDDEYSAGLGVCAVETAI